MIQSSTARGHSLRREIGLIGIVSAVALTAGAVYGVVSFLWKLPTSLAEIVFPLAAIIGAGILFQRQAFLCAIISGIFAMMLLVSVLIATESAFTESMPWELLTEPLKSMALHGMLAFSSLLSLIVLLRSPREWVWAPPTRRERSFARATLWPALLGSQLLAVVTIRGPLITEAGYWSEEYAKSGGQQDVGLEAIGLFLLVYAILAALRGYGWRHLYFKFTFLVAVFSIVYFRILRGERSSVVGFALFFAILYYMLSRSKYKYGFIGLSFILVYAFVRIWARVRWAAVSQGVFGATASVFKSPEIWQVEAGSADRFSDSFWYLLHVANLYDMGIQRRGLTYLNLLPQMIPAAIADAIGYQRPLAEPWVLAEYIRHGGGIHVTAEAYWNFGIAGMIAVSCVLGWVLVWVEKLYRRLDPIFSYGYFGILALDVAALTGGIQAVARGLEIGILVTGLGWLLMVAVGTGPRGASSMGRGSGP